MTKVTIYTTTYCGFCRLAKELLERKAVPYQEVDVTHDDAERARIETLTGQRTWPQIFIGKTHVGGFTDMSKLDRDGVLDGMLNAG